MPSDLITAATTPDDYTVAFDIFVAPKVVASDDVISSENHDETDTLDGADAFAIDLGTGRDGWHRVVLTGEAQEGGSTVLTGYVDGVAVASEALLGDRATGGIRIVATAGGEPFAATVSAPVTFAEALPADRVAALGTAADGPALADVAATPAPAATVGPELAAIDLAAAPVDAAPVDAPEAPAVEAVAAAYDAARAPGVANAINHHLIAVGETLEIDLGTVFAGTGLTYEVTAEDGTAVDYTLENGILTVEGAELGYRDFTVTATDGEGGTATDDFRVRAAGENAYTIAVMPDTQDYAHVEGADNIIAHMTEWLAYNKDSLGLSAALHVGDVTNSNSDAHWKNVSDAYAALERAGIPYTLLPGNHDQGAGGGSDDHTTNQDLYFGPERYFAGTPGGVYDGEPNSTANNYKTFTAPDGTDWLVLSLEFGPRDDVLRWANDVLTEHSDHRAIVMTHHYTNMADVAGPRSSGVYGTGSGKTHGLSSSDEATNDGRDMWDTVVSKHANVSFVFSGHVFGDGAETIVQQGEQGNSVVQMLVNYQGGVAEEIRTDGGFAQQGGNGQIRLVTIDPDNDAVYTETYMTELDRYMDGSRGDPEPTRDGTLDDGDDPDVAQPVTFGTTQELGFPALPGDDGTAGMVATPQFNKGGLWVEPGFEPDDASGKFLSYTMVWDMYVPQDVGLVSLLQTDVANQTDGDLWLQQRGGVGLIGTDGQDDGPFEIGGWRRIVTVIEATDEFGSSYRLDKYVDGQLIGSQILSGDTSVIKDGGFVVFGDDGNETPANSGLSAFALVDTALDASEVEALGGVTAGGPFERPIDGVGGTQWSFDRGNFRPDFGDGRMAQTLDGIREPEITQPVTFGTTEDLGFPALPGDDGSADMIATPQFDGNGLWVDPGFRPDNGGEKFLNYTMVWDMYVPANLGLVSILQTDVANQTDGDLWLQQRGGVGLIGTDGQDDGPFEVGGWRRIVTVIEASDEFGSSYRLDKYVDGVLIGSQVLSGDTSVIKNGGFVIFGDDGNETPANSGLSAFALVNEAMTGDEVAALGGVSAGGPFTAPPAGVDGTQWNFANGSFEPTFGDGRMQQTPLVDDEDGTSITGRLREHEETIDDLDLSTPDAQFRAVAGDDVLVDLDEDATVVLDGTKSVDPRGQVATAYWTDADGEIVGTGLTANVTAEGGAERYTLTLVSTDGTVSTDTTLVAATDDATLLYDGFDDGDLDGWDVVSGTWKAAGAANSAAGRDGGHLQAYTSTAAGLVLYEGAAAATWDDYTVTAEIENESDLAMGLVAGANADGDMYRLTFDVGRNQISLVKVVDGVETVLATQNDCPPWDMAAVAELSIDGGTLMAAIDGRILFGGAVQDTGEALTGTVGVFHDGAFRADIEYVSVREGSLIVDAGADLRVLDTDGDGLADVSLGADGQAAWSLRGTVLGTGDITAELGVGDHVVRLDQTVGGESGHDTVRVEVVAQEDILLVDDFSDASRWSFVDEGELGEIADWSVVDGKLVQAADRYSRQLMGSGETAPDPTWGLNWSPLGDGFHALRKGTYALLNDPAAGEWDDYSVAFDFEAPSGGAVGLMFHYQDENNYYKLELDRAGGTSQLVSMVDGIEQIEWQGSPDYDIAGTNRLRLDIVNGRITATVDGKLLFAPFGLDHLANGTIGLYNWGAPGTTYDNLEVVRLDPAAVALPGGVGGTDGGDSLTGTAAGELIYGLDGDDSVDAGRGDDTVRGNAGADVAFGGEGADHVRGNAGDDTLSGDTGADTLLGDTGDDALFGGGGADELRGGQGGDTLRGNAGDDALSGHDGDDRLLGDAGDDSLTGNAGADTLRGGDGADTLAGGEDDDQVIGNAGDDAIAGQAGADTLNGGEGADTLAGGSEADVIRGGTGDDLALAGSGADVVHGDAGNDALFGHGGADRLFGDAGDDTLTGGEDADTLAGGEGDDSLVGDAGADLFVIGTSGGDDRIADYEAGVDRIDLRGLGIESFAALLDAAERFDRGVRIDLAAFGGEDVLTLENTRPATLVEDDFLL